MEFKRIFHKCVWQVAVDIHKSIVFLLSIVEVNGTVGCVL